MKRFMAVLSALLLMLTLVLPCYAAGTEKFLRSYYVVSDDVLQCYGAELPGDGTLTVTIGSQKIENVRHSVVAKEGLPVTVYCLVDTSTAMSHEQVQQQKNALLAISDGMKDGDCMVIATLGESLEEGVVLTDRESRERKINSLERSGNSTNLFEAVVNCIGILSKSSTFHTTRCLVILSDGVDDGLTSVTEQEVINTIQASTIPVYSVAVLDLYPGWYALEHAKHLERFADASVGGAAYTPADDGISAVDAGMKIWSSMQNNTVIEVPMDSIQRDASKDTLLLMARYETADARYEDTMTLYTVDLPEVEAPTEATDGETTETTETTEPEKDEEESNSLLWIAIAAGAVALVAVVIVIVYIQKKKKNAVQEEAPEVVADLEQEEEENFLDGGVPTSFGDIGATFPPAKTGCKVYLTAIGHASIKFDFFVPINSEQKIGRDSRADIVLNPNDTKLSGIHCVIKWDGKELHIKDADSTNGSAINGVPMTAGTWMYVEDETRLRLGGYEYRIRTEKVE